MFPFAVAIIYSIVKGPRIVVLLLITGILTFLGHPLVTMFVFAISLGIFYGDVLFPAFGRLHLRLGKLWCKYNAPDGSWISVTFAMASLSVLFALDWTYATEPSFSSGEKATYDWIRANTESDSTYLMEGIAENLVYFGRRKILLPVLGAEWVPSPEYGNGLERSVLAKAEIYDCRELDCLSNAFLEYGVTPDYLIYRIDNGREMAWIDELVASPMFELAFDSGSMIVLHRDSKIGEIPGDAVDRA
ncbi:MAG: hypothetical protein IH858_07010 [Chloroflexi bacterium]|nr:hypothetical protein [Chloroflexota bacterium]